MADRLPPRAPLPAWRLAMRYLAIALILFFVLFGYRVVSLYTDWLWFGELGRRDVFSAVLTNGVSLYIGFGLLFFLVCYFNLWLAQRLNAGRLPARLIDFDREQFLMIARGVVRWVSVLASVFIAFLAGGNASSHWSEYLQFTHASAGAFALTDPVFGRDVSFYVFRLPFLGFLQSWFLFAIGFTAVATAIVHAANGAIDLPQTGGVSISAAARRHLLGILALFALVYAWGIYLGRYDILYSDNGQFIGAGYVDVHVRLPAATISAALMGLVALLCVVGAVQGRSLRAPGWGLAGWLVWTVVAGGIAPALVQNFTVTPNQFEKERPYIGHDIRFTQRAYGLDRVSFKQFPGAVGLRAADVAGNAATLNNIRLWDWPQLGAVYTQKQALNYYYRFTVQAPQAVLGGTPNTAGDYNIDVDRYRIGGQYRQVMLGAREMNVGALRPEAQTWVNTALQYTHGYGAVMSPVNEVDPDGFPVYFMRDIPVSASSPELTLNKPQIYFGEAESDYVFVDSKQRELDYGTQTGGSQDTTYTGRGGVKLGGALGKLAWSMRLAEPNMLLSSDLTADSRILYRRNIRDRVMKVAPFLNWDNDPYLIVTGGRLVWMMDAYTVTDRFPYSKPYGVGTGVEGVSQEFNYIRNSVKATVDAYDGTVSLYASDPADPILRVWQRVFPALIKPLSAMPEGLRAHIRYPEDLFRAQRDIYAIYHISDPRVYYGKEDAWEVPLDATTQGDTGAAQQRMAPYFIIMRLPGETDEEFLLMTPFSPLAKNNMAAWMCAKCDPEHYGQIEVYRFPKGANVNGPQQIVAQINQDPTISRQKSLLNTQGSRFDLGNLLAIPVNSSLLYVAPVYLTAAGQGGIPQIKAVIAADGNHIVMENTLPQALASLTSVSGATAGALPSPAPAANGQQPAQAAAGPSQAPAQAAPAANASVRDLLNRADNAFGRARQKQQEYNQALDDLGRALRELQNRVGR